MSAYAVADRILIDVEDHCGGLPPGSADRMFLSMYSRLGGEPVPPVMANAAAARAPLES